MCSGQGPGVIRDVLGQNFFTRLMLKDEPWTRSSAAYSYIPRKFRIRFHGT